MIDFDDLHKTWSLIAKNRDLKTDNQWNMSIKLSHKY